MIFELSLNYALKHTGTMRSTLVLFCSFIAAFAMAQPPFQKVYDNGQASSQALAATSTPDGGSAFIGIIEIPGAASEVMVTKLTCAGDVEWVKILGASSTVDNVFPGITSDEQGRIWFASNIGTYQNYDGILGTLSKDGDLLQAVRLGKPGRNDQLFGLVLDSLGHVYVTGATNSWGSDKSGSTSYTDVFMACLDTSLNMVWARTLGNAQNIDTGFGIDLDSESRPIATGRFIVNGTFFGFCLRLTPDGSIDLFKGFGESLVPHRTYGYGISSTKGGHILLTGSTTLNKQDHQSLADVYLIKLDEDGIPLFSSIYIPLSGSDNSESGSSVVEMADGRYAIGVPTMSFTTYTQGFVPNKNAIFVSGPDGSLSEARLYNNGGSHYTKIQDRPNGFLMSNFSTKYGGPSFFKPLIITTDSDLNSGCNEIDVTQQVGLVNEAWEFVDITFSVDTGYTIQPYSNSSDYAYQLVQVLCETPEDVSGTWEIPDTVCLGENLVASADGMPELGSQNWQMGDGTVYSNMAEISHVYVEPGTYSVKLKLGWQCASLDFAQNVVVLPISMTEVDTAVCTGETYFAAGEEQQTEGTYRDTLAGERCDSIIVTHLSFRDCNCAIDFANVFTPNGDQTNDLFLPFIDCDLELKEYSLTVYNRYGKLVFETGMTDSGWDGTFNAKDQPMDVYGWVCSIRYIHEGKEVSWTRRGDISLVR